MDGDMQTDTDMHADVRHEQGPRDQGAGSREAGTARSAVRDHTIEDAVYITMFMCMYIYIYMYM